MRLREWRRARGLSQRDLAAALSGRFGVAILQSHVTRWERGSLPRKAWLVRIAEFTGGRVTANDFVKPNPEEGTQHEP